MKRMIVFLLILSSNNIYANDFRATLSQGKVDSIGLSLDMTLDQIESIMGEPRIKRNIMGWGYYDYPGVGIFFEESVGYYENDQFVGLDNGQNKVAFIRFSGNQEIFSLRINETKKDDAVHILGTPDEIKIVSENEDGESLFSGTKLLYFSNEYCLSLNYNEDMVLTYITLLPKVP